jgi:hypothetical protein
MIVWAIYRNVQDSKEDPSVYPRFHCDFNSYLVGQFDQLISKLQNISALMDLDVICAEMRNHRKVEKIGLL